MASLTPYEGTTKKLVLAFDVGTTYSGISYCLLEPGKLPEVKSVTKFPAQELVHGSPKIPSIIYYDQEGVVRSIGAETLSPLVRERAEHGGWIKVEWFKLQLRPPVITSSDESVNTYISPLPAVKNAIEVLADYYEFLYRCAREFIRSTYPIESVSGDFLNDIDINFVLPHPNGWDFLQWAQMRKAAVLAKLIPDTLAGQSKISFVTEGEASLHFAIMHCLPGGSLSKNTGVIIVDAGGGTIDMSAYKESIGPDGVKYEEICARRCHLEGSIFVSRRLEHLLHDRLARSKFAADVPLIAACFDADTKLRFRTAEGSQFVKFGSDRDNDVQYNIRYGKLELTGKDIASCFEPPINCIVNGLEEMIKAISKVEIKRVVLLGGFAASDWLYDRVNAAMLLYAVPDGAISSHIDTRYHIHLKRPKPKLSKVEKAVDPNEKSKIWVFYIILHEGPLMHKGGVQRPGILNHCRKDYRSGEQVGEVKIIFLSFPMKMLFEPCCCSRTNTEVKLSVRANLSHLNGISAVEKIQDEAGWHLRVTFDVTLISSDEGYKAVIEWDDNGTEKKMDATVIEGDAA